MTAATDGAGAPAPDRREALVSYGLLSLTALFWSGNVVLGRGVIDQLPPLGLNFWRWVAACLILLPFTWRAVAANRTAIRRDWKILAVLGLLGITCFNALAYKAFQTTTAINAALINATMPITVMAITLFGFRERVRARQATGLALAFVGTLVILTRGHPGVLRDLAFVEGDLWMLVAVSGYALYSVLLRFKPPELDGAVLLTVIALFGLVIALPLYLVETAVARPMPASAVAFGMVAYVAVFPSVLAYGFWNRGVGVVGPRRAALFVHLMPVFTALLAIAFLGESLHPYHFAGMALVFGGLVLSSWLPAAVQTAPANAGPSGSSRTPGRSRR